MIARAEPRRERDEHEEREEYEALGMRSLLMSLLANRWWIIGSAVFFTVLMTALAFTMTPVYRASAILVPARLEGTSNLLDSALGQLGGLGSLVGLDMGRQQYDVEEALTILRSRQFTEKFIEDKGLMPKLFADEWDAVAGKWKKEAPTPADAYRYFNEKIRTVSQDKRTGLVTLSIDWIDRHEAASWANELAQRLNEEMRTRAMQNADASVGFLEQELTTTSTVATREAIGRLIEAQVKKRMLASVTPEYAFRIVDRAMAPDEDDPIRPKKLVMIVAGPLVGVALAVFIILVVNALRWEHS